MPSPARLPGNPSGDTEAVLADWVGPPGLPFSSVTLSPPPPRHSEGVFKCPEDQLPLDYAKVSSPCQVHALAALGGGWSCRCSRGLRANVNPVLCAPTKVACSLLPGQFANEACVCPGGRAQCPACGGAQSFSVPTRSVPLPFGWLARPVAEGQDPSNHGEGSGWCGGLQGLGRLIGCHPPASANWGPRNWVGADATCCPLGSEGSLVGERMFLALRKPASQ